MKSHFTNPKYDFFKYAGKSRATVTSFNKRKDKYWFEKLLENIDQQSTRFSFIKLCKCNNPQNLWIGEIINSGEKNYSEWMKRQQSLTYLFKEQSNKLLLEKNLDEVLNCSKGHPVILKRYLGGDLSLETLVIFEKIFSFGKNFDKKKLKDPVWETVSLKIKKYIPFINIKCVQLQKNFKRGY